MSKSYKVAKKTINMGEKKGQTVFSVRPYSYGTLTTEEVANQIAVESTATPADVKAVLDRYAYYVKENLKKGYDIELLGFGKLYIRFITGKAVEDESKANAKLVKSLVPAFLLRRKDVNRPTRCSEPLRSKVGGPSKVFARFCGMGPPEKHYNIQKKYA